jgi:hypothetical protein
MPGPIQNSIGRKTAIGHSAERYSTAPGVEFKRSFLIEEGQNQGDYCAKGGVFPRMDMEFPRPTCGLFADQLPAGF